MLRHLSHLTLGYKIWVKGLPIYRCIIYLFIRVTIFNLYAHIWKFWLPAWTESYEGVQFWSVCWPENIWRVSHDISKWPRRIIYNLKCIFKCLCWVLFLFNHAGQQKLNKKDIKSMDCRLASARSSGLSINSDDASE